MRRLLSVERHQKILERVASENAVDFASLADELGVSSMTVRRDLHILEEAGYLKTNTLESLAAVTGFSSYSPFYKSFKLITSTSPQTYFAGQAEKKEKSST